MTMENFTKGLLQVIKARSLDGTRKGYYTGKDWEKLRFHEGPAPQNGIDCEAVARNRSDARFYTASEAARQTASELNTQTFRHGWVFTAAE